MDWGMKNRLSRLMPNGGKAVWLAIDHGYFLGPISKLEDPAKTIKPLIQYTDALMLTRGVLRNCIDAAIDMPFLLRVSGGNSIAGPALSNETIHTSMEEALRLNASAVAFSIYVGTEHENQTLSCLGRLVNEGQRFGMPVLAVTAVGKELEKRDARYLSLCCRIAAELGAQAVKTYYCDDFEKVVNSCPVPIVVAGGPKLATPMDALHLAQKSMHAGARGVDMGRNIWQSDDAVGMIRAIRSIVHDGSSVKEAAKLLKKG
ncbi:MAG: 3-hydroxy-5-phosphonooxypentane-2,4-dione thiolase [Candidatus Omnitrophica bacterium]|nr:3-hydroxy-5-phosphonooxypentane-2,4-dione thiolase [Candidatus Omnitrophota bacterium]